MAFGICIGSFLNAVIYRLPRKISLSASRSRCPHCNTMIRWFENIPICSYIFLRGKCSKCNNKISIEYPLVEIFMGIIAFLILPKYFTAHSIQVFFFQLSVLAVFLSHTIIDLRHKMLPDALNIYLGIIFLAYSVIYRDWMFYVSGAAIGFAFPYLVTWIFYKINGKIGLGGGDIKLFLVLGIFLGPMGIMHNIFLSCFLGSIVTIFLIILRVIDRKTYIPFGPFIIAVASIQIFFPKIIKNFLGLFFV